METNIKKISKFFSGDDFNFNLKIGQEYLNNDINMTLFLYRVDSTKTEIDDVYGEVGENEIKYLPKIEINCLVKVDPPKNSAYKNGILRYSEPGNLIFYVYIDHLNELGIDINYGDYIGYPENDNKIRYYSVSDNGSVISDNKHNMFGFKPYYKTINCVPAQETEFNGI
jgi:hypothetical protein